MGLRGPLPKLTEIKAAPLADLTPPPYLPDLARQFWAKHAANLSGNGLLTVATADSFAVVCDLWARLREMGGQPTTRAYLDTVKAFQGAAKPFRLLPTEKPVEQPTRHGDKPEFEF